MTEETTLITAPKNGLIEVTQPNGRIVWIGDHFTTGDLEILKSQPYAKHLTLFVTDNDVVVRQKRLIEVN